jgi:fructose-bisphosphate aldolase class II
MAITAAIRKVFKEEPKKFDPREYLGPAREAHAKIVAERMRQFGSAGHAKDYKCMTLEENKAFYKNNKK